MTIKIQVKEVQKFTTINYNKFWKKRLIAFCQVNVCLKTFF